MNHTKLTKFRPIGLAQLFACVFSGTLYLSSEIKKNDIHVTKAASPYEGLTLTLLYMASTAVPIPALTLFHKPAESLLHREV